MEIQVKAGKRAFSIGDVRLYASKKSASLTNFNAVYTHFTLQGNQPIIKMGRYKLKQESEHFRWGVTVRKRAREHEPQRCIAP